MKWPLVMVRWLDSCDIQGWKRLNAWPGVPTLECVSVGYLVAEDETTKTIAPHVAYPGDDENSQGAGIMVIPARAIVSVTPLTASSRSACAAEDHCVDRP
jgi:hypothetical protein